MPEAANTVEQVAIPVAKTWAEQLPTSTDPFLNSMVPVGVTPEPETVAVRMVLVPVDEGLGLALSTVVVVPLLTVRGVALLVEVL